MKRIALVIAIALAAVGIWVVMSPPEPGPKDEDPKTKTGDGPEVATATGTSDRKSLIPEKFPGQKQEDEVEPEDRDRTVVPPSKNPASGLEMVVATDADREDAKVPDKRWGKGVIVMKVKPDSPADEVRLRKGDLIVRAQRTDIHQPQDLIDAAEGRDHVVITFVRKGRYLQAVLKKPYDPNE